MSYPPQQPDPYGNQPGPPQQWWYPGQDPHGAQQGYPGQPTQGQPGYQGQPTQGQQGHQPGQAPGGTPQGLFGGTPYWAQQAYQPHQQWGPPQPPPRRSRAGLVVAFVVFGALLLVGGGIATWFFALRGDDIVAGDCFGSDEVAVDAEIYEAECGSAESGFRVVKVVENGAVSRCAGSFVEQERGRVLCTTFDVQRNDCLTTGGNPEAIPIKVDCADPEAQLVVNEVKRTEPGRGVCPKKEIPFGTRVPPMTLCLSWLRTS